MTTPRLAHLIHKPAKPYIDSVSTDVAKTVQKARQRPLVEPVRVDCGVFDLAHPLHPANIVRQLYERH